jgi:hypothetical protein
VVYKLVPHLRKLVSLQSIPSKAALPLINERNDDVAGVPVEEGQEKPLVDVRVTSPVASGQIEREERQEQEHREKDETEREIPKEEEREERDRMDLSKLPLQWTSKGVKPESRPEKSEKACQFFQLNFFSMRSKVCF